eukprot:152142-Pyramimonas_sp.AAC.2
MLKTVKHFSLVSTRHDMACLGRAYCHVYDVERNGYSPGWIPVQDEVYHPVTPEGDSEGTTR